MKGAAFAIACWAFLAPCVAFADPALQAAQDQLQLAIVKRDAPVLRTLIRSGMNLDFNFNDQMRGRSHESPLTLAIYRGHLDMARLLLEGGASAKRADAAGLSPIHQARSAEAVRLLVEFGADVNAPDARGRTAVVSALERGDMTSVDMLVANGARVDAGGTGPDLFTRAIESGHPEAIEALLDRGVDPRSPPTQALFPLIESGDTARALLLIRRGADVNARKGREGVLARALYRQRWEVAHALVDAGANVRLQDSESCGASFRDCLSIQLARFASFDPATLRKLKAKGLDLDALGRDGYTALTAIIHERPMAIRDGGGGSISSVALNAVTGETVTRTVQPPVATTVVPAADNVARVKALLDAGADPNRKFQARTPLMLAIALPDKPYEMARMLVPFGARVEYEETLSRTKGDSPVAIGTDTPQLIEDDKGLLAGMKIGPLGWTVLHGRADVAMLLIERDRKVTAADRDIVYFAAVAGSWELVARVIPLARNVDVADRADRTALMMAASAGNLEAIRALLAGGAKVNARSARIWPQLLETNLGAAIAGHSSRPPLVGGYTALRAAKEGGHADAVRLLVEAGGKE